MIQTNNEKKNMKLPTKRHAYSLRDRIQLGVSHYNAMHPHDLSSAATNPTTNPQKNRFQQSASGNRQSLTWPKLLRRSAAEDVTICSVSRVAQCSDRPANAHCPIWPKNPQIEIRRENPALLVIRRLHFSPCADVSASCSAFSDPRLAIPRIQCYSITTLLPLPSVPVQSFIWLTSTTSEIERNHAIPVSWSNSGLF